MGDYLTIGKNTRVKISVGACKFIASVGFCQSEDEAKAFIEMVSNEFADATHNVYAYRIGTGDKNISRFSDAGEPVGTAGPPILSAIENAGLTNVVIVGTRYFGGVKQGIGGLIRAYRACAEVGLKEAGIKKKILYIRYRIIFPYDYIGQVMNEIPSFEGEIQKVDYSSEVTVEFRMPPGKMKAFQERFKNITRGKGKLIE